MHDTPAYEAETEGVLVRVRPSYLAGQSDPDGGYLVPDEVEAGVVRMIFERYVALGCVSKLQLALQRDGIRGIFRFA